MDNDVEYRIGAVLMALHSVQRDVVRFCLCFDFFVFFRSEMNVNRRVNAGCFHEIHRPLKRKKTSIRLLGETNFYLFFISIPSGDAIRYSLIDSF